MAMRARVLRARFVLRSGRILIALALLPSTLVPGGTVLCIEACGEMNVSAPHATHACSHGNADAVANEGDREISRSPSAPSFALHSHRAPTGDRGCTDLSSQDEWVRTEKRVPAPEVGPGPVSPGAIPAAEGDLRFTPSANRSGLAPHLLPSIEIRPLRL